MRFWVLSDLHLDVNIATPLILPKPRPAHDAVLVAGDLCESMARGVRWIAEAGLNAVPVVYVGGNHEFYGTDRHAELAAARQAARAHPHIHVLERDSLSLGGVTILGATLWTDYALYGDADAAMRVAERYLSDHRLIADGHLVWSAGSALREHKGSRAWLTEELARAPDRSRTIVVTHHAPSEASTSGRYKGHPLTAAFVSDLDDLMTRTGTWIHGHTHRAVDYVQSGCRVVANPRGYVPREKTGFRSDLVIEV